MNPNNPHRGSDFVEWLKEEGIYEEVKEQMRKEYGHLLDKKPSLFHRIISYIRNTLSRITS